MSPSVTLTSVQLRDPFWLAWQRAFLDRGLAHQFRQCEETGRLENFRRVARGETGEHEGYYFNDSDVYKWLEAASYALADDPEWEGRSSVEEAVQTVAAAQSPDGYIGTPFQIGHMEKRWHALTARHEMYCIGHLIEAGVAHRSATGSEDLLGIARRAAEHVKATFGPGLKKGYCGHEEIELAFCRLSALTDDPSYRDLARWMVETRGSRPSPFEAEYVDTIGKELNQGYVPLVFVDGKYDGAYFQDDRPLVDQTEAVGHAVRAMYLYCGAVDACDDPRVMRALKTIWSNLVRKRMYVTGGIGSAGRNEGFTNDFDLPNREAYAETCAAIGLVMWAARMSRATGDARYAEVLELALYNAALSGVNLDTDAYFYVNPLESRGDHLRKPWYGCACCPPNIARLVMSVKSYAAHVSGRTLTIDVPWSADYVLDVDGSKVTVAVESEWPWSGGVAVKVEGWAEFEVRLRVPEWRTTAEARLNSQDVSVPGSGYLSVHRQWKTGDTLEAAFGSAPAWVSCDPRVADNIGRVALKSGPLVFALEEADLGSPVHLFRPDRTAQVAEERSRDVRQAVSLAVKGSLESSAPTGQLYGSLPEPDQRPASARFIPYFAWANRSPGSMAVWHRPTGG